MSQKTVKLIKIPSSIGVKQFRYDNGRQYLLIKGYYKKLFIKVPFVYQMYIKKDYLAIFPSFRDGPQGLGNTAFLGYLKAYLSQVFRFVETGYLAILELKGVGFRLKVVGNKINFLLGFSHMKTVEMPTGIFFKVGNKRETELHLFGYDKQQVCQVAANLKTLKKPDYYKGKGIFLFNEEIQLKQGKQTDN